MNRLSKLSRVDQMAFSSSLVLADMDYIAPSQACIKPELMKTAAAAAGSGSGSGGIVYRHTDDASVLPQEILKISLQDCLACSGCVTTAETMLVTSQSRSEVELAVQQRRSNNRLRRIVVTISEQSAASAAAHLNVSCAEAFDVIGFFARSVLNADVVTDLAWAERISVELTTAEYLRRVRCAPELLPLIVSSCPGWVCYCEKQCPELLPHLSPILSAQGIAGRMLKASLKNVNGEEEECDVYHISIQPCFDRKLEAARDAASPSAGVTAQAEMDSERGTDCVLSTAEVLEWMLESPTVMEEWRSHSRMGTKHTTRVILSSPQGVAASHSLSDDLISMLGSGGFHLHAVSAVIREAQRNNEELPQEFLPSNDLSYEIKRNANLRIVRSTFDSLLVLPSGSKLRNHLFGIAYGFQHIQNLVRGLKKKLATTPPYTFLEVMACPSGCLNGGGQVRVAGGALQHDALLERVRVAFVEHVQRNESLQDHAPSSSEKRPRSEDQERDKEDEDAHLALHDVLQSYVHQTIAQTAGVHAEAPRWATAQFHDRKKDMESILNANPVHSLKW